MFKAIFKRLELHGFTEQDLIIERGFTSEKVIIVNSGRVGWKDPILFKYLLLSDAFYKIFEIGEMCCIEDCIYYDTYRNNI